MAVLHQSENVLKSLAMCIIKAQITESILMNNLMTLTVISEEPGLVFCYTHDLTRDSFRDKKFILPGYLINSNVFLKLVSYGFVHPVYIRRDLLL